MRTVTEFSVVVPTLNSSRTLDRCLRAIAAQTYPPLEVLVVDGGSSDETAALARQRGARVFVGPWSMSSARNIGLEAVEGEWLLNCDSDMELGQNVLEQCRGQILSGRTAVLIPEVALGENFWERSLAFGRNLTIPLQESGLAGVPRCYRTRDIRQVGGWNPKLTWGEDIDLYARLRPTLSVGRTQDVVRHHESVPSLSRLYTLWRSEKKWGSYPRFAQQHPLEARDSFFREHVRPVASSRGLRTIARHPVLFAGSVVLRGVKAIAAISPMPSPPRAARL